MRRMLIGMTGGLLGGIAVAQLLDVPLARDDRIPTSSIELERRLEPWCPGECTVAVPFIADYRQGRQHLVFVATHHAFEPHDPTMRAVRQGFRRIQPRLLISESFPTEMGVNPAPLVEQAHHYGDAGDDEFLRSEFAYALSLALRHGVPFLGAELTRVQEMQVARQQGFTDADLGFASLAGLYSQGLRAGNFPDMTLPSLEGYYAQAAARVRAPPDLGGQGLEPPPFDAFRQRYRDLYGVDLVGDTDLPLRIDVVFDRTRMGDRARMVMKLRDRHLLALIEQQLDARRPVLVVFGSSHWATLSAALEQRLGTPAITPFLD